MRNRITRYEVALTDGARSYLVGYTPRKGRPGLLACVQGVGSDVIRVTGLSERAIATYPNTRTMDLGENGWRVTFTGRTQIDAQDSRELPFIKAV